MQSHQSRQPADHAVYHALRAQQHHPGVDADDEISPHRYQNQEEEGVALFDRGASDEIGQRVGHQDRQHGGVECQAQRTRQDLDVDRIEADGFAVGAVGANPGEAHVVVEREAVDHGAVRGAAAEADHQGEQQGDNQQPNHEQQGGRDQDSTLERFVFTQFSQHGNLANLRAARARFQAAPPPKPPRRARNRLPGRGWRFCSVPTP